MRICDYKIYLKSFKYFYYLFAGYYMELKGDVIC